MTTETPTQCETPHCQGTTTEKDGSIGIWIDESGKERHLCQACIKKITEKNNDI